MSFQDLFKQLTGQESLDDIQVSPHDTVIYTPEEGALIINERDDAITETAIANLTSVVEKAEGAMEVLADKVEDLQNSIQGMENMRNGSQQFNADLFAYHYNRAAKISNQFGLNLSRQGAESFAGEGEVAGLESMKDVAVKAGAKIKELFVKLYNGFLDIFDAFFNSYSQIGQRADILQRELGALAQATFPDKVTVPADSGLLDSKGGAAKQVKEMLALANGLKAEASTSWRPGEELLKATQFVTDQVSNMGKRSQIAHEEGTDSYEIEFNNATFTYVAPRDIKGLAKMNITDIKVGEGQGEISALGQAELKKVLSDVSEYCKGMRNVDLSRKGMTTVRDAVIAKSSAQKRGENVDDIDVKAVTDLHTGLLKVGRGVNTLLIKTLKAQLGFVQAHLNQAKTAKNED